MEVLDSTPWIWRNAPSQGIQGSSSMKSFLGLLAVVAVAALWYWQVPVRTLLHQDAQSAAPEHQQSSSEALTPAAVASMQAPAAVPS